MDLLDGIGDSISLKASEKMIAHFNLPLLEGAIKIGDVQTAHEPAPLHVGVFAIVKTMKEPKDIGSMFLSVISILKLKKAIPQGSNIRELHFKREFSNEEHLECYLYQSDIA